jgi:hypothetical protein
VTRLSTHIIVTASAAAAVSAAMVVYGGAPAMATNAGPVASVVNADDPSKASGSSIDPVEVTAPAACNSAATRHVTKITGVAPAHAADRAAAKAWVGDNLYATASVGLPGPLTVQSSNSWQGLADGFGQKLVPGRYDLVLRCQNNVGTKIYEEWHGAVIFTSPTAWKGSTGRKAKGATAPEGTTTPSAASGTASPGGTTTTTSVPSAAGTTAAPNVLPSESADKAAAADVNDGLATGEAVKGISLVALFVVAGAAATVAMRRARRRESIDQNSR